MSGLGPAALAREAIVDPSTITRMKSNADPRRRPDQTVVAAICAVVGSDAREVRRYFEGLRDDMPAIRGRPAPAAPTYTPPVASADTAEEWLARQNPERAAEIRRIAAADNVPLGWLVDQILQAGIRAWIKRPSQPPKENGGSGEPGHRKGA